MSHGWIITKDHLAGPGDVIDDATGTTGPSDITEDMANRLLGGEGLTWKVWDDDGELYYSGRMIVSDDAPEYELAAPLAWATGAGAVYMEYVETDGRKVGMQA